MTGLKIWSGISKKMPEYSRKLRKAHVPAPLVLTLDELNEFDIFNVINGEGNAEMFEEYAVDFVKEKGKYPFTPPPLKEGVMKFYSGNEIHSIKWTVLSRTEDYCKVSADFYLSEASYIGTVLIATDTEQVEITTPADILKIVNNNKYLKPSERRILDAFIKPTDMATAFMLDAISRDIRYFLAGMDLFNSLLTSEKEQETVESQRVSVKCGFRKAPEGKRRVIYLNGMKIECGKESGVSVRRGIIVRKANVWDVRGHYRHYKNGRVIYIEPFQKGENRNTGKKAKGKEYKLK